PTTEEINLTPGSVTWFLSALRPEIAQTEKCNYIEWKNGRLAAILAHALHAEEQQMTKKEQVKTKTVKELQLALVQAVSRPEGYLAPRYQQTRGGEEKDGAEDPQAGLNETQSNGAVQSVGLMI
ncbi:hypothetical protein M9458_017430, partial [Cirrhinus mrigala]